ncbi:hypothetical protein ANN_22339 [Periplaneta americana]|uniref:LRRCT domain-containing protein n=1 Tax=Periplaneta americana TaxID=6978 RepID=A0ABQ8S8C8_PERAM|nr:hypothetical protein ANN_22339 [Periplaneta americana]
MTQSMLAVKEIGLTYLYKLQLQHNHIGTIDLHAFAGVTELKILDLSYNHLYYLLPAIFEDTPKLKFLYLQGNRLKLPKGPILIQQSLEVLDLSSCQLDHFENDAFSKLPALLSLYLKNNQLIRLEVSVLKPLEKLQKIDLVGNPWPCDGKTDELEVWLNNNNKIKHDPICEKNKKTDKFERIISLVDKENATNIMSDEELLRLWSLSEKDKDSDLKQSESDCDKNISVSTEHNIIIKFFDKIPSFWSFMIGLEIGIVVGGIIMFIIHKLYEVKEPESPRSLIHSRGRSLLSLQNRTSFIRFRSDGDESTVLWTELETINCPDTPPPAYRDCLD